jgi:ComF family protein
VTRLIAKRGVSLLRPTLASHYRAWLAASLDLAFPPHCVFCHCTLESSAGGLLCRDCRDSLTTREISCNRCGSIVAGAASAPERCPRCERERLHFEATVRLGSYDGSLRWAVLRTKRSSERPLAMALGDLLAESQCDRWQALGPDAIVPIPMHWSRRMLRGTNSPEAICERIASRLKLPVAEHVLTRCRRTAPQANLSPHKRLRNLRGAFRASRHADLPGARLLLVDDIMTTGATLNEAAKTLRRAGASFVAVAVLARAEGLG